MFLYDYYSLPISTNATVRDSNNVFFQGAAVQCHFESFHRKGKNNASLSSLNLLISGTSTHTHVQNTSSAAITLSRHFHCAPFVNNCTCSDACTGECTCNGASGTGSSSTTSRHRWSDSSCDCTTNGTNDSRWRDGMSHTDSVHPGSYSRRECGCDGSWTYRSSRTLC